MTAVPCVVSIAWLASNLNFAEVYLCTCARGVTDLTPLWAGAHPRASGEVRSALLPQCWLSMYVDAGCAI